MRPTLGIVTDISDGLLADSMLGSDWILRHSLERHVSTFSERLKSYATCLWDYNRFKYDGPIMDASYLQWWAWYYVKQTDGWKPKAFWRWLRCKLRPDVPTAETIQDSMRGRLLLEEGTARLGGIEHDIESLLYARRLLITACGTSWHAALLGEYMIEEYVRLPVEVEYASEFRYRDPIIDRDTVILVISQSGETADTLAAVREAKRKLAKVYGICNVVGSSIARETDAGVYLHAGPEIGVASTKAFTSQITVLALLTLLLGRMKMVSNVRGRDVVHELRLLPGKVAKVLEKSDDIRKIAAEYMDCRNFLYLGRGYNFPVALEGALKLKEISYIHAEGYPAAEMKHGPIALIDKNMPVVCWATKDSTYDKVINNMQEVKARKGRIIAIASEGDEDIRAVADHVIYVPHTMEFLAPIVTIIPAQLLAYHMAVLRDCNVDQPRNLAKSVTVE